METVLSIINAITTITLACLTWRYVRLTKQNLDVSTANLKVILDERKEEKEREKFEWETYLRVLDQTPYGVYEARSPDEHQALAHLCQKGMIELVQSSEGNVSYRAKQHRITKGEVPN